MSVKIRVSIPVTVRSQDPKPKKNQLISYCNTVCVPAQKRSQPARSARFIFLFGEMANHLGWGAPKHIALMTCLYMLVSSHMEIGLRHATPLDC